jgi:hypothetical protein
VQPFERLRHVARWTGDDDTALVMEAADCLAGFADDAAGLVVACRRLLVHHPASGPLWWLCAHVLTAADPARAAWDASRRIERDPTIERAAERLPFPHDEPIALVGGGALIRGVTGTRPDLDLVAVRVPGVAASHAARLGRGDAPVRVADPVETVALRPTHLLVASLAAGPTRAAVPAGTGAFLDEVGDAGTLTWLVAGVADVVPERLLMSLARQAETTGDENLELVELVRFGEVAGPTGPGPASDVARRVDCPVPPELLRLV